MSRNVRLVTLSLALAAAGCEDLPPPPTKAPAAEPAPAPRTAPVVKMAPPAPIVVPTPSPPAAPTPAGMEDPFGRLAPTSARNLDAGWRAMRKKDWGASRDAFHAVVLEHPDYVAARFQELRATVLDGDLAAVPALWRELLARDFVGYADKLDKAKEMKSLRASPQWTQLEAIRAEARSAYGAGLDRGLFFVARTRGHLGPKFDGDDAKLELDQEAYHFDPATRRIRRLSDTGGHVVAVHRDGEHRQLVILTARALKKTPAGDAFATPEAMALSLDTLERSGPLTPTPTPRRSTCASRARASRCGRCWARARRCRAPSRSTPRAPRWSAPTTPATARSRAPWSRRPRSSTAAPSPRA